MFENKFLPANQVGSNTHSPLSPYVPSGPIAPLLLRQARILASLLHANHSWLRTSFPLQIKSSRVKSPLPTVPIVPWGPNAPLLLRQALILASLFYANHSCLWTSFSLQIKSSGVQFSFPIVPICSRPHCPMAIAPSAYSCLPFARQSFMSVNKFLLVNQVKLGQIHIPHCPHMFHRIPLPHCYWA